jgi:hypothetical protein
VSDWPGRIERLSKVHQRIDDLDEERLWAAAPPSPPATLVAPGLPADYRDFLVAADGWTGFYRGVDLLPADELAGPVATAARARAVLGSEGRLSSASFLVIGAAPRGQPDDLFVLLTDGPGRGSVLWLGGGEVVDEFESFSAFFDGVAAHAREEAHRLEARW